MSLQVSRRMLQQHWGSTCKHHGVAWQVRSAYRKKGWAFSDPQQIDQCAKEGFMTRMKEQEGEGCHLWGTLAVNKARPSAFCRNCCARGSCFVK